MHAPPVDAFSEEAFDMAASCCIDEPDEQADEILLSIIMPFLNCPEIVRRQVLHFQKIGVNDFKNVEIWFMDDGSDPPLTAPPNTLERFTIYQTNDKRPWTSSLARNLGAKICRGPWCFMVDGDFILTRKSIETALKFCTGNCGDRLGVRRELAVIDEDGNFTQDLAVLRQWGIPQARLDSRGAAMPPHPNHFIIRKSTFWALGGYDEKLITERTYPQGEDNHLKKLWLRMVAAGKATQGPDSMRPTIYMFPNGQFCGDVDANPFGFFHNLTRKTPRNPWKGDRFATE